jgi:hypothetical protein
MMQHIVLVCNEADWHVRCSVRLERVTTSGEQGYLVFVRHETRRLWMNGTEPGLVVHVSGDTLYSLCMLLRGVEPSRPMPLDVLSGVLSHAREHAGDDWGLVKVAIVALKGDTYIGRVYFGARATLPYFAAGFHSVQCAGNV